MDTKKEKIFIYFGNHGLLNIRQFKKDIYAETKKINNHFLDKSLFVYQNEILKAHDRTFDRHLQLLKDKGYIDSGNLVNGVDMQIDGILDGDVLKQSVLKSYLFQKLEHFLSDFTSIKHVMVIDFNNSLSDKSEDEIEVTNMQRVLFEQHKKLKYIFEIVEECEYIDICISGANLFELYYWSVFLYNRHHKSAFVFDYEVGDHISTDDLKILAETYDYLNKEVRKRVMVLRGTVDQNIEYSRRVEAMKNSIQRVKYTLDSLNKVDKKLEIFSNNLNDYNIDDLLFFVKKYNINYINAGENSYEVMERLFLSIIEMISDSTRKDALKKWEQIEERARKVENMFSDYGFSGKHIQTPLYLKKYSKILKNQVLSYMVKVFYRYYQFEEKDLRELLKIFFSIAKIQKDTNIMKNEYNDLYVCYPDSKKYGNNGYRQLDFIYPYHFLRESDM